MTALDKPRLHLLACVMYSSPAWVTWITGILEEHSGHYAEQYDEWTDDPQFLRDKLREVQELLNTAVLEADPRTARAQLLELMDKAAADEDYNRAVEIREEIAANFEAIQKDRRIKTASKKAVAALAGGCDGIDLPQRKAPGGAS